MNIPSPSKIVFPWKLSTYLITSRTSWILMPMCDRTSLTPLRYDTFLCQKAKEVITWKKKPNKTSSPDVEKVKKHYKSMQPWIVRRSGFSNGSSVIRVAILSGLKTNPRHLQDGQPRSVRLIHGESSLCGNTLNHKGLHKPGPRASSSSSPSQGIGYHLIAPLIASSSAKDWSKKCICLEKGGEYPYLTEALDINNIN